MKHKAIKSFPPFSLFAGSRFSIRPAGYGVMSSKFPVYDAESVTKKITL